MFRKKYICIPVGIFRRQGKYLNYLENVAQFMVLLSGGLKLIQYRIQLFENHGKIVFFLLVRLSIASCQDPELQLS